MNTPYLIIHRPSKTVCYKSPSRGAAAVWLRLKRQEIVADAVKHRTPYETARAWADEYELHLIKGN